MSISAFPTEKPTWFDKPLTHEVRIARNLMTHTYPIRTLRTLVTRSFYLDIDYLEDWQSHHIDEDAEDDRPIIFLFLELADLFCDGDSNVGH
jgi:hypothetical protein